MGRLDVQPARAVPWRRVLAVAALAAVGFGCSAEGGSGSGAPPSTYVAPPPAGFTGTGGTTGAVGMTPGTNTGVPNPGTIQPGGGDANSGVGTGGTGSTTPATGAVTGSLPCDVAPIVKNRCQGCHAATPLGGAPMSLMTLADFQKDHVSQTTMPGTTMKVYQWVKIRINDKAKPMPQGQALPADELATMNAWLDAAAPAGTGMCAAPLPGDGTTGGAAGAGGTATGGPSGTTNECDLSGAYEPLVPRDGETCYDFPVHGQSGANDTSKFTVQTGEAYHQFYYDIPWPKNTVATRFGGKFDNLQVLHHWLAFTSDNTVPAGTVMENVTGATWLSGDSNATLIGGWAIGGCGVTMPEDVGLRLPDAGKIMIQWHMYNTTGTVQQDATAVQFCTVPDGVRPHTAGMTWLGTENISVPPGGKSTSKGSCINDSSDPITILMFWPHMHTIGVEMKSEVQRASGGALETVFDEPFEWDLQLHYMMNPPVVLQPNDTIISTCYFENPKTVTVGFGQSTDEEMCYQFAISYPAGALDNGVPSLIGATNTCWQPGE